MRLQEDRGQLGLFDGTENRPIPNSPSDRVRSWQAQSVLDLEDLPDLQVLQHTSADYRSRTAINAQQAHLTVAFAADFSTAGERLTKSLAGSRYIGIELGCPAAAAASKLRSALMQRSVKVLNVAGNGAHSLSRHGWAQRRVNTWIHEVLRLATAATPVRLIRSGGQTGVDTAGIVAALALGIPAVALLPKGFRQRPESGVDVSCDAPTLRERWLGMSRDLEA